MFSGIGAPEIIIVAVLLIVIFGWKRLPDAARSLGRSARVFKSEVDEMKSEGTKSQASSETVQGDTVRKPTQEDLNPRTRAEGTSPISENSPRTDNTSGPVS